MKLHIYDVLKAPLITEKVARYQESQNKYAFRIHPDSNKKQVKAAIEKIYNVHVVSINTSNVRGKWRRVRYQPGLTASWKKAIVTIKSGEKIDITG